MAKLVYLNHSGFLLELENAVLVFDYYTDPADVLETYTGSRKAFVFFVSHAHYDHWNLDILDFRSAQEQYYFLEEGCQESVPSIYEDREDLRINFVRPGFSDNFTQAFRERTGVLAVRCFGSTDEGVSFLVETTEGPIFHSGDLNVWDWEEEGEDEAMHEAFRQEMQKLSAALAEDDLWLSMIPVDLRLGPKAFLGATVFLEYVHTQYLIPDHLNGGVHLPGQLAARLAAYERVPEVLGLTTPGQSSEV